ncbi:hypothetical protein K435DRAFT_856174 [Dendrothele bispora CBS 962.96]|uniref:Uncharacterized protein n=1 Tax=Dendrothele bispora (strain CBS 962.96) TaxID=1314807 RepID=A0A4S8M9M6_DENBC|nr:hypothetical protein K435DRAFT_856174 [Dendrothele bispora CBS 962.96]
MPDPDPSDIDTDSDNKMSKAAKAFDKVTTLKKQMVLIGEHESQATEDAELLNGITGTLLDSIFQRYKSKKTSEELWEALKVDYDAKNPLTKAHLEQHLFATICYNPAKFNEHLDNLILICDELEDRGFKITESQFKSAIIASVISTPLTIRRLSTDCRIEIRWLQKVKRAHPPSKSEPQLADDHWIIQLAKKCSSKKRQQANTTNKPSKDDKGREKKGKGNKKETASCAVDSDMEESWMAIETDESLDSNLIDIPTIDCSEIAEAALMATNHDAPPYLIQDAYPT